MLANSVLKRRNKTPSPFPLPFKAQEKGPSKFEKAAVAAAERQAALDKEAAEDKEITPKKPEDDQPLQHGCRIWKPSDPN